MSQLSYRIQRSLLVLALLIFGSEEVDAQNPVSVTLLPATSPAAGEPGVTNISVIGSNFPAGTIPAANVTVKLTPKSGGPAVNTPATLVTTVVGTTRRVSFTIPASVSVVAPTPYQVTISGTNSAAAAFQSSNSSLLTVNPPASISTIMPNTGQPGQTLSIAITGSFSNFLQGATVANFGTGITINSTQITDATHATVSITINANAAAGPRTITMTTGVEVATLTNGFSVSGPGAPTITDFNPKGAPVGTLITMIGTNLQPNAGTAAQFTVAKLGGGTLTGIASTAAATSLTFVIPAGTATGVPSVTVNGQNASAATALTIVPSSTFSVNAAPGTANLIQGQSVGYSVKLTSTAGFDTLAALSVAGVPSGVTAAFQPQSITAGQTSILTLTAPGNQAIATAPLTISASAIVSGLPVTQTANVSLSVTAPTTSFLGRTVVSDSLQTPLAGVTITMLGKDGNGNVTGCTGGTVSDPAGNFLLTNLPPMCVGPQLVGFNGTTATSPPGTYAGVNLVFTFNSGQVTASPVLVHLPRIDNVETFLVQQNSSSNQNHSFTSIPGLAVIVYAGTTFTMPDGTQPNPFPLAAVQVPVDRLPDAKPFVPTMIRAFIVAFQPANATTNQPVAVIFPNTLNTPPGTDMALMTLDPTRGQMVPYGTGAVSSDGTQIVPDPDPTHAGHLYGLVHFDWHGPMPPNPPPTNPSPPCQCPPGATCFCPVKAGSHSVDVSSGIDVINATDIAISGPRGSISIVRTFRTLSSNPGPFGIGSGFNYGYQLGTVNFVRGGGLITLVMPDGNQFPFNLQQNGTFVNTTVPTLRGAVLTVNSGDTVYSLRWKDGTVFQFQTTSLGGLEPVLTSITDPNGNAITLTFNPSEPSQINQIIDPVGRSLNLSYDASNRVTLITDPIGRTVQYAYNSAGYLATVTDPNAGVTTYSYDNQNNLISVKDPRGVVTEQNTYDANGRVIQQVQADGGIYQFVYTLLNPLVGTSPPMLTAVTDPLGNQTTYRFDPNQLLTDATDPSGQTKSFTLDTAHSSLVSAISGTAVCASCGSSVQGNQTYTLDENGNILSSTDALGNTTTYTYESIFNKVTSITDPLGDETRFTYDSNGNLLTRTDPNGNTTSFTYLAFGQVGQTTDPTGAKTIFTYDSFGNLATVTDALGNTTSTAYDGISRPSQTIDALGRRTQTAYDALSRVVSQTNAQNNVTRFTYDAAGNLLSITDARSNTTSFTYDPMSRLVTRTTPLGTSDSRSYDFNGNLITFRDRRGQTSSFGYDSLNRLVTETYADSTVARSYDANGRLVQVNDSDSGLFEFTYDLAGRQTGSTSPVGGLQYTYDAASRLLVRQVDGQTPVNYVYDRNGNVLNASITGASISRTYDPRNLMLTASRSNGVTSQNAYDVLGRVVSIMHSGPGGVINNQSYSYDAVNNRLSSTTGIAQSLATQAVASGVYDVNNEQKQFGSTTNTFDANGNLASSSGAGGSSTYTRDSRNRLVSIAASSGQTTRFTYDFTGNLIQQIDAGSSLNLTQTFVLDDITNLAYVSRSDGDQYSVLAGRSIDDHIAAKHASGQIEYGLADAVDSTIATVDQTGARKGRFEYEPFGQTTASNSNYPFQFTGRVPVSNSLYYYRARFYNPTAGRFVSEDPIGFKGGMNFYRYVSNNPILLSDPTGMQTGVDITNCVFKCIGDYLWGLPNFRDIVAFYLKYHKIPWAAVVKFYNDLNNEYEFLKCVAGCINLPPTGGASCAQPTFAFLLWELIQDGEILAF